MVTALKPLSARIETVDPIEGLKRQGKACSGWCPVVDGLTLPKDGRRVKVD
jgi:hypothetical protein